MNILAITDEGNRLIDIWHSSINHFFPPQNEKCTDTIMIITPHPLILGKHSRDDAWPVIHRAWQNINSSKRVSCLDDWRKILELGQEIIPGLRIFKLKRESDFYFLLLNEEGMAAASFLNNIVIILSAWQHFKRGRVFIHGAGIVKQNQAYLFLGASGAGKSTISTFSSALGLEVLHDDHVVAFELNKRFYLSDVSLKRAKAPLKAVFLLNKDKEDELVPISQKQTALSLYESFFETIAEKALFNQYLANAFTISAEIARKIPGYELHFTQSSAFWKVIGDELVL